MIKQLSIIGLTVVLTMGLTACGGGGGNKNNNNSSNSSSSSSSSSSSASSSSASSSSSSSSSASSSSTSSSSSSGGANSISISGKILLPDGETPLNNATVYIVNENGGSAQIQKLSAAACVTPTVNVLVSACTDGAGDFELAGLAPAIYKISVVRGAFFIEFEVDARNVQGTLALAPVQLAQQNGAPAASMALVTGAWDSMENVLAKTGFGELDDFGQLELGTETFDIYDGDESLSDEDYPNFEALFEINGTTGIARIYDYSIVFINCGVYEYDFGNSFIDPSDENVIAVLRDYVENGGRLYATDLAYDYIEQAFPEYLDFYGDDELLANEPEGLDVAERGLSGIVVDAAQINDPALGDFLSEAVCDTMLNNSCLNADGTMYIEGFLSGWAILNGAHEGASGVTLYTEGEVESDMSETFVKPLTASFSVGAGFVFYSSYHSEDTGHSGFLPQERVMQYLIFE